MLAIASALILMVMVTGTIIVRIVLTVMVIVVGTRWRGVSQQNGPPDERGVFPCVRLWLTAQYKIIQPCRRH